MGKNRILLLVTIGSQVGKVRRAAASLALSSLLRDDRESLESLEGKGSGLLSLRLSPQLQFQAFSQSLEGPAQEPDKHSCSQQSLGTSTRPWVGSNRAQLRDREHAAMGRCSIATKQNYIAISELM